MSQLLLVSSTTALVFLIVHSWRTRGRVVTLAFFLSALAFGILRGNAIWLLCKLLFPDEAVASLKPYMAEGGLLPEIGHDSPQVALGWVFSMYLAWTISELILKRLPRFAGRVFMIGGLASLFMVATCWCMETTAVTVGWWYWTLPTRTALFGNVNVPAMEGWFSVVPDFLIPFLVIACSATRRTRLKWLWLLAFPLHLVGHLMYRWFPYAYLVYAAMELLVVALMMFSPLRMARGETRAAEGDRTSGAVLAAALAIFFGVVTLANLSVGGPAQALTALPMLMLCLLAWRRLPAWAVAGLSLVALTGWVWMGPRVLWALTPVAVWGFLALLERTEKKGKTGDVSLSGRLFPVSGGRFGEGNVPCFPFSVLRAIPIVVLLALLAVSVAVEQIDRRRVERYLQFWAEGDRLALAGRAGEAEPLYRQSDRARPEDVVFLYLAVRDMASPNTRDPREAGLILECRLERLAQETGEIVRRDPGWSAPREDLALYALLLDRPLLAVEQYRQLLHSHPRDGQVRSMLAYVLLRAGNMAEAEESCVRAMELRKPPVEAMINLGVIRFSEGKDDEARALWDQARTRDPKHPMARANIERLTTTRDRRIDLRYLACPAAKPGVADLVDALALHGSAYSDAERVRLLLEAAQLGATLPSPHLALAQIYRHEGPLRDLDRAPWHARHAADLARDAGVPEDLAEALLVLGETLITVDRKDEARRALEEGRTKAPAEMIPEFDRLLRMLPAPRTK